MNLNNGFGSADFQNLSRSLGSIGQFQGHDLRVFGEFDVIQNDEWTIDTTHRLIGDARLEKGKIED